MPNPRAVLRGSGVSVGRAMVWSAPKVLLAGYRTRLPRNRVGIGVRPLPAPDTESANRKLLYIDTGFTRVNF
jgi:hypothetical protein